MAGFHDTAWYTIIEEVLKLAMFLMYLVESFKVPILKIEDLRERKWGRLYQRSRKGEGIQLIMFHSRLGLPSFSPGWPTWERRSSSLAAHPS
jgi:hypothetical protein